MAENNIKVEYECITPLAKPEETRKHIEQFSIYPSLSSYKSPLSNMVHFRKYKVIFDNGKDTLNIDGVYLTESNNYGSLGFKVTETPSIKRIIENGGNVTISFNGTKNIINFDGYKEGYYLMNECLTKKIKN